MTADIEARLALVGLPQIGPARARWLLAADEAPAVVAGLSRGRLPAGVGPAPAGVDHQLIEKWASSLRALNIDDVMANHRAQRIELLSPVDPRWPFAEDPEPPILLFYQGDLHCLDLPTAVAVVGTRRCTTVGRTVAYEIGNGLASAGAAVISGLALGIDGAAHRGALDAGGVAIGVVGSGLDVVYPGGNRSLWDEVKAGGLLISEAPAGARPERWRFPARNRLIAALCDGLVIVESHGRGGALLTVDEAIDRGRPVFSVPGSVLSPASDGTNGLLVDGATPVRHTADVLGGLGIAVGSASRSDEPADARSGGLSALALIIMAETATGPVHVDRLVLASGRATSEVLAEVQSLVGTGRLILDGSTVSRS